MGSLAARLRKLEERLAPERRRFVAVVGCEGEIDHEALKALPAAAEVTVICSGVPRNPDDPPGRARMVVREWRP